MGDVNGGHIAVGHNFLNCFQYFNLSGDIQSSGWFVEDNQIRTAGHSHGHHHTLKLSSRNLMRPAFTYVIWIRQVENTVKGFAFCFCINAGHYSVVYRTFGELIQQSVCWVKSCSGTLCNIRNSCSTEFPFLTFRCCA